ncbi:MAG TPA: hypothetical protein VHF92_08900 [Geodermatophilus sp.]|nr:hypothetical protein [Geodermatophilus sp.]
MATGRIRRSARRGLAGLLLGWLTIMAGSVLLAPSATAAPSATVAIRDVTPPVASVDAGGSVTFVNQIQDKTVQVSVGGIGLVNVTVKTDVSLRLPSGARGLQPGQSMTERFDSSCVTCAISFTYRAVSGPGLTDALLGQAVAQLPGLPVGVPFVVNTLVPLPEIPSVNLPSPPAVEVPVTVPGTTTPTQPPVDPKPTPEQPPTQGPPQTPPPSVDGTPYTYDTGSGGVRMSPVDRGAAAAFDPARFPGAGPAEGSGAPRLTGAGGGGLPGTYDGASVPVFGQLAGLDGATLDEESAEVVADPAEAAALPLPAVIAVLALAAVSAALVRTHVAQRTR